jgi:phosphoenolpyruvate-protein kinase (PTS system EI component)
VSGIPEASLRIKTGDRLFVDGLAGVVFVHPSPRSSASTIARGGALREIVDRPSATLDGVAIPLLANVNKFADTEPALLYRAEGIGLYRTEFQFSTASPPSSSGSGCASSAWRRARCSR